MHNALTTKSVCNDGIWAKIIPNEEKTMIEKIAFLAEILSSRKIPKSPEIKLKKAK